MDDRIRPVQAAKRRSAHGEEPIFDSADSTESYSFNVSADESSNEQSEDEIQFSKEFTRGKRQKLVQTRLLPRKGTRRSTRKFSEPKTSYNMGVHPQDKFLVISSDDDEEQMPSKKRRKLTHSLPRVNSDAGDGVAESKTVGGEEVRQVDSGESDSNGEPALISSELNRDQVNGVDITELSTHSPCIY